MSIHNRATRLGVSFVVFLIVLLLIVPSLMDAHPPALVELLLKPARLLGGAFSRFLPHPNIGTPEHPVYEGTPIDLLVGLALAFFCVLLYPVAAYFFLSLLSRVVKRREMLN
jgi:hypothetical protein